MTTEQAVTAVLDWIRTSLPELQGGYSYIPTESDQPLPDVVVDVAGTSVLRDDPRFPMGFVQQAWVRARTLDVSFMVDDTDPEAGATQLRGFEDALIASLLGDGTLGGRVPFVSPYVAFDYTLPFVERPDGTRGREMNMTLLVGELVEEQN